MDLNSSLVRNTLRPLLSYQSYYCVQVNVGCVPKKVMFNTAVHAEYLHDHKDYGFDVTVNKFDWRYALNMCLHKQY